MRNKLIITIIILVIGLVWWGCENTINPTQPIENQLQVPISGPSFSWEGVDPITTYELFAGQNILVGEVQVTNNDVNIFVKYIINDPDWCLYETHVVVGEPGPIWPEKTINKQGNPSPGQFTYGMDHACIDTYTYTIPIPSGDPVAIAAHAKIGKEVPIYGDVVVPDCWETVWQIGDVEVINGISGNLENYADEFNWGAPAGPNTMGPSLVAEQPAFTDPFIVGTTSPAMFPYNSNASTAYSYATDFDVQWTGALPFGGRLVVSWSPGQSAAEEKEVYLDAGLIGTFNATGTPTSGTTFMDKYPLTEDMVSLDVALEGLKTFTFKHTTGDGTFWDWVRLEKPCTEIGIVDYETVYESAWAADDPKVRFVPKGNWATWFEYDIACEEVWDVGATWVLDFAGGTDNREFRNLVLDAAGNVTGEFWWLTGGIFEYGGTLVGTLTGDDLYLFYDRDPIIYTGVFTGVIGENVITDGTFNASSGFSGTWTATGQATFGCE